MTDTFRYGAENFKPGRKISRRSFLSGNFHDMAGDTQGATAAEYALLIALISSMIVAGVSPVGQSIASSFSSAASGLKGNSASAPPPSGKKAPKKKPKKK